MVYGLAGTCEATYPDMGLILESDTAEKWNLMDGDNFGFYFNEDKSFDSHVGCYANYINYFYKSTFTNFAHDLVSFSKGMRLKEILETFTTANAVCDSLETGHFVPVEQLLPDDDQ